MTPDDPGSADSNAPPSEPDEPAIRLRLVTPQGSLVLRPGEPSAELDALLESQSAETIVFVPLWNPKKAWKKEDSKDIGRSGRRLARRRKRLGAGEWGEGELERVDGARRPVPAAWCTDLRRYRARLLGEELGFKEFYWACRGGPVEVHRAELFGDDGDFELESVRALSQEGLRNMRQTAVGLDELAASAEAVGSDMRRFTRTAVLAAVASTVACALGFAVPFWLGSEPSTGVERALDLFGLVAHPVLLPAVIVGAYLRRYLGISSAGARTGERRELSTEEVASAWHATAPHLLAVWIVAAFAVLMLTVGKLAATGELGPVEIVDKFSSYCILLLWVLTPLTYARDTTSAVGSCVEAAFTAFVVLLVLKITMIATSAATHFFWTAFGWVVPFVVPEWIRAPFDALASIGAELFFFTLILGYTWTKTREHFGRWATVQPIHPAGSGQPVGPGDPGDPVEGDAGA